MADGNGLCSRPDLNHHLTLSVLFSNLTVSSWVSAIQMLL